MVNHPPSVSSRRYVNGFIDRQLLTGVQQKLGDESVGEIQLCQHFDVTAGVNSNRAEVLGQCVGHQVVRSRRSNQDCRGR